MYSSSSSFSLSFPRALKASRKTKSRERRITPRSKKMSNRCFVNFAANGDDDDRTMVAAEQIATSKSTIDSSKVDFAMPNRLLSSDLTTVRFSFSPKAYIKISEFKNLCLPPLFFFWPARRGCLSRFLPKRTILVCIDFCICIFIVFDGNRMKSKTRDFERTRCTFARDSRTRKKATAVLTGNNRPR